jgi:hypothetical protein
MKDTWSYILHNALHNYRNCTVMFFCFLVCYCLFCYLRWGSFLHEAFDKTFIVIEAKGVTGGRVKHREIVEFLKEILRECGNMFVVDMIWLRNAELGASPEDAKYQLVIKAKLDKHTLECIKPIAGRYGLEMKKQEDLWIFAKDTKTHRLAFSSNEA